jgi:hypothetical protein
MIFSCLYVPTDPFFQLQNRRDLCAKHFCLRMARNFYLDIQLSDFEMWSSQIPTYCQKWCTTDKKDRCVLLHASNIVAMNLLLTVKCQAPCSKVEIPSQDTHPLISEDLQYMNKYGTSQFFALRRILIF